MHHARPRGRSGRRRLGFLATAALTCAAAVAVPTTADASPSAPRGGPTPATSAPVGTFFDDFHYSGPDDAALADHGWHIRSETGGPGVKNASWSPNAVSFPADDSAKGGRAMRLRATTDGTAAGTTHAQITTTQRKFATGTYAARVYFSDAPGTGAGTGGDHPVQAFYAISPENKLYSELDFEYLPNGGWGAPGPSLYTTAWYSVTPEDKLTYNKNDAVNSLRGWHTLAMTAKDGTVTFSVDGQEYHRLSGSAASKYYPRENMTLNFNEWFTELTATGPARSWDMKANWVYYNNSAALTPAQIDAAVDGYYASGTHFVDTVLPRSGARDHNGDGVDDISLFYDYGPATPADCPQNGSRRNALFSLAGRPDQSGRLDRPAPQWNSPCEAGTPKFVVSGDFDGDGKGDTAAFYNYGSTGSTCQGLDHVAVRVWPSGPAGAPRTPKTVWESTCWGGGTQSMTAGDFDGDGKSDLALLYDYGAGHVRVFTLSANASGDGGFGGVVSRWDGVDWGSGTKFVTAGDFNGDGKSDLALFIDHGSTGATCAGNAHQSVSTLLADTNGDGGFNNGGDPKTVWESTCWGGGTQSMTAGDFDGDGKSDLALLYDYGAGHVRVFTLSANASGDGGFGGVVSRWDGTNWGSGTKFVTAGDYNADGKSDLALFIDHGSTGATCAGNAHQSVSTLLADPYGTGALQKPVTAWESTCWGPNTAFMN
ncbi:family 16 glycosylhydrolase [Streptomyces gamaensis]|uniref:Family 16 glycosylhydrolase n=1 Tax=Streptomyces gamaensis TaxID=1763542 RepID=A0ABW0Z2L8_9ACTN